MDITLSARHMGISPALRAAADEKFGRLRRFGEVVRRVEVHFCEERNGRIPDKEVCEAAVHLDGHVLRCKASAPDPYTAIDLAVAKLDHQLHKVKTKYDIRARGNGRSGSQAAARTARTA